METVVLKERESNIELLRIIAELGVIFLHYTNHRIGGGFLYAESGSTNMQVLTVLESFFICAVNTFMMTSGYFQCKSLKARLQKPLMLVIQLVLFEMILYALKCFAGQADFSVLRLLQALVPVNYFVVLYSVTYILSPYLNLLISKLSLRQFRGMLLALFLLFSLYPEILRILEGVFGANFNEGCTITFRGTIEGYTIVNFILCYLIGAGYRCGAIDRDRVKNWALPAFILCWIAIKFLGAWRYYHPLVILQALSALVIFSNIKMKNSKVINSLASSVFTVYLLHETFLVRTSIRTFVQGPAWLTFCHVVVVLVGIYLICHVIHILWRKITDPIFNRLWACVRVPVIDLSKE